MPSSVRPAALLALLLLGLQVTAVAGREPAFHFEVTEGRNLNYFIRDGKVAAHLVLRSGPTPRLLVAFPAGNSGVGLWFQSPAASPWSIDSPPAAITARDSAGRPLYGITFEASIRAQSLQARQAILSSVRVLRDYQSSGTVPQAVLVRPQSSGNTLSWARNRLDGAPGYRLTLAVVAGTLQTGEVIFAGANGRIRARVTALSGETPLTPLSGTELLNGRQDHDPRARDTLTFLSYEEKLLAGSWRFDTYFGRDTLMSVRLLMPVLAPQAIEAGLRSVLARLSAEGEVAHEEGIGEFAVLSHKKQDGVLSDAPVFDYSMIDGNYLLAPVLAAYVLENPQGKKRAADYLRSDITLAAGQRMTAGQALVRNLRLVARTAGPFSAQPRFDHLISLKPGHDAGQWRDSEFGLGGGRYPYDVNAVLVAAALESIARLLQSGLLDPFISAADRKLLGNTDAEARVWRARAPGLFDTTIDNERARASIVAYAKQTGVPAGDALSALGSDSVRFHGLSLDAAGKPVPIVNSDEALNLLFGAPAPATLHEDIQTVMRPFPLGLLTDAGLLVANPAFADDAHQAHFTNHAYHGTVVWSWQQALLASGIQRQLERTDLPTPVIRQLLAAQQALWRVILATRSMRSSELWSWRFEAGRYSAVPFGSSGADADESNAAQLWSSVYLAVKDPQPSATRSVIGAAAGREHLPAQRPSTEKASSTSLVLPPRFPKYPDPTKSIPSARVPELSASDAR
jgi:hypothetical protein